MSEVGMWLKKYIAKVQLRMDNYPKRQDIMQGYKITRNKTKILLTVSQILNTWESYLFKIFNMALKNVKYVFSTLLS